MSKIEGGTIKERLARLETLMCNHLEHHRTITRFLLGISITSVGGFVLMAVPQFVKWLIITF